MIPVVNITWFFRLACKTMFSSFFSKTSAIVFMGVLISVATAIFGAVGLSRLDDVMSQMFSDDMGDMLTNNSFWALCYDFFALDYLFKGLFVLLGIALALLSILPTILSLLIGGVFAWGGMVAVRRFISTWTDITYLANQKI